MSGSASSPAARAVERYLHIHIPLTAAMQATVLSLDDAGVRLAAPLAPNINHRHTVFGGSAAALAILSAWTLIHTRLRDAGQVARIVIQRSHMDYLLPLHGAFEAFCPAPPEERWARFMTALERRGRGRIVLHAELYGENELAGRFEGTYVALAHEEE